MADPKVEVLIGLGANLGDREARLRGALERLDAMPGIAVCAVSPLVETDAVGGPPQGRYLNGVARLATDWPPHALLALFKALERDAGRDPAGPRNGPRPLDLDLLTYGMQRIDTRDLIVPHPRLFERPFVLEPLAALGVDIAAIPHFDRPETIAEPRALQRRAAAWRAGGCSIGLVPTMGALHAGHQSLFERARAECDRVIATIFVNPLQFGVGEDFERYPRPFDADLARCREAGVDVVFAPPVEAMYPPGFASRIAVGAQAAGMEGAERPGHFEGVATVVARLWSLALPDRAYFGQKDAQQVAVLGRLHADLGLSGELVECDIVREPDGLALSSRNRYLDAADRAAAPVVHAALQAARAAHAAGERSATRLLDVARARLAAEPRATLDYLELRDDRDLAPLESDMVAGRVRMLVAARFGSPPTRLLDNLRIGAEDEG